MSGPAQRGGAVADVVTALSVDASRPRFTGYTDAGRTELSGTVLLNWASKVAGLLVDELGARPGDRVVVRTPAHWQTAGIVLGAWWAGVAVSDDADSPALAAFVAPGDDAAADEVFVVSGHPFGLPATGIGAHQRDYSTAVLPQADRFQPRWTADGPLLHSDGTALSAAALRTALRLPSGLTTGQRLLTAGSWGLDGRDPDVVRLLMRPLAAGASVIHSTDLDPAADPERWAHRASVERVDATAGVDVDGLPRLG